MKNKLIIFDMDNTILRSRIDFPRMKQAVHDILDEHGLGCYKRHSVAFSMNAYTESADYDPELAERMWREISLIEDEGLRQAVLEPGAAEALAYLGQYAELATLTNNTEMNLADNLGRLGLLPYLSCVAGRGTVPKLKPAPDGLLWVLAHYPGLTAADVLSVGDAMNDAYASRAAGMGFVAYNNSRAQNWEFWQVEPLLRLTDWDRESCDRLRALFG